MSLSRLLKPRQSIQENEQKERELVEQEKIDELLRSLDQQRSQGNHFVAIQTDYRLDSSLSFSQYTFKECRLITLIGEIHNLMWNCSGDSLTVAQYCKMAVERNPKCRIMLEFNHKTYVPSIGSEAIKTIVKSLEAIGRTNQIIPFDKRDDFLTQFYHYSLYQKSEADFVAFGYKNVFDHYVTPFYENIKFFDLNPATDLDIIGYLHNKFLPEMGQTFDHISEELNRNTDLKKIRVKLWHAWKKVCDFFILSNILSSEDIDEYIVIVGEEHKQNIDIVINSLPNVTRLNLQYNKNQSDCVSLFKSYLV